MAGTTLQPSHEPPGTRDKKKKPAPITLKYQWKEREKTTMFKKREGRGGGRAR